MTKWCLLKREHHFVKILTKDANRSGVKLWQVYLLWQHVQTKNNGWPESACCAERSCFVNKLSRRNRDTNKRSKSVQLVTCLCPDLGLQTPGREGLDKSMQCIVIKFLRYTLHQLVISTIASSDGVCRAQIWTRIVSVHRSVDSTTALRCTLTILKFTPEHVTLSIVISHPGSEMTMESVTCSGVNWDESPSTHTRHLHPTLNRSWPASGDLTQKWVKIDWGSGVNRAVINSWF